MVMAERDYSGASYRYGFNNQEKDNEISGLGNTSTAEFWEYDTRLSRRWNLDPVPQLFMSDYSCFANNPILNKDPNGEYRIKGTEDEKKVLRGFVKGFRKEVLHYNKEQWNKIKEITGMGKLRFMLMLVPGFGPILRFQTLDEVKKDGALASPTKRADNTDASRGGYSADDKYAKSSKKEIILDRTFFNAAMIINDNSKIGNYSNGLDHSVTSSEEFRAEERKRFTNFVNGTLGHETAHVAAFRTKVENQDHCGYERGFQYEMWVRRQVLDYNSPGTGVIIYIEFQKLILDINKPRYNDVRLDSQRCRAKEEYQPLPQSR
jgi:hypothetical protein